MEMDSSSASRNRSDVGPTRSFHRGSSDFPTTSASRHYARNNSAQPNRPAVGPSPAGSIHLVSPYARPHTVGAVRLRTAQQANNTSSDDPPPGNGVTAHQPQQAMSAPSTNYQRVRRKNILGTMRFCGSVYEEMTRQLMATGEWTQVQVRQRSTTKVLYCPDERKDLAEVDVHLLLGEKLAVERLIENRRDLFNRFRRSVRDDVVSMSRRSRGLRMTALGIRMPMGNGEDGEPRVVDFAEGTRCITLKSTMVTTLLQHHRNDWRELGRYLPVTFKLVAGEAKPDERDELVRTSSAMACRDTREAPMWIAKSSAGCHGDNIEIFKGNSTGMQRLLRFIDRQKRGTTWVAQQYIDRPLLYHKRKFDIRCFVLFLPETYEIFVHEDLVMRMSSLPYDRESATSGSTGDRLAHITNHCIQATGTEYSKHEEGNELWREHLDGLVRYRGKKLGYTTPIDFSRGTPRPAPSAAGDSLAGKGAADVSPTLRNTISPQIHHIARETVLAAKPAYLRDPDVVPTHSFHILGYDFIIDDTLKVWLLEINGAPGGALRLLPRIIADTIELAVTPHFPSTIVPKPKSVNGYTKVYPLGKTSQR